MCVAEPTNIFCTIFLCVALHFLWICFLALQHDSPCQRRAAAAAAARHPMDMAEGCFTQYGFCCSRKTHSHILRHLKFQYGGIQQFSQQLKVKCHDDTDFDRCSTGKQRKFAIQPYPQPRCYPWRPFPSRKWSQYCRIETTWIQRFWTEGSWMQCERFTTDLFFSGNQGRMIWTSCPFRLRLARVLIC